MGELEAILNDQVEEVSAEEPSSEATETVETTATEAEPTQEEKPEDQEVKQEKKEDPEPIEESWTKKAALDERRKRQEMERERDELKAKLEKLETSPKQDESVDLFDDPQGFEKNLESRMDQKIVNMKAEMSRSMMIDNHEDYEEAELKFFDLAKENPLLRQQAMQHPHPAKFVYEQVKRHDEFQQFKDGTYQDRLRAEIRKELETEMKASQQEKASKVANITPSLANESSIDKQDSTSISRVEQLFDRW